MLSQLGMICWFEGRYEEGLRACEEGLALARELESPALVFASQLMLANNLHCMGRVRSAIAEGRSLCEMISGKLESARLGAPAMPMSMALSFVSWFMVDSGDYAEGVDLAERGLHIALRERDLYGEVLARNGMASNLLKLHRNEEAAACLAAALEVAERNGYDAIKTNLVGRMAIALARSGRADEAIALVEDCLRKALNVRTGQLENYYLRAGYAEALLRRGESERGLAALDEALAIARRIRNPCLLVDGLGLRARMLAELAPADPRINRDLAERRALCEEYALPEWPDRRGPDAAECRSATGS
jgi:tetratricopeptide (TPR) repeat protein